MQRAQISRPLHIPDCESLPILGWDFTSIVPFELSMFPEVMFYTYFQKQYQKTFWLPGWITLFRYSVWSEPTFLHISPGTTSHSVFQLQFHYIETVQLTRC